MPDARAEAMKWADDYEIREGEEYDWVEEYAKDEVSKSENSVTRLDEKAAFLFRLVGALTLGLSIALLKLSETTPGSIAWFLPGMFLMVVATGRVSFVIRPTYFPVLPRVKGACEYVRYYGKMKSRTKFYLKAAGIQVSFKELLAGKSRILRKSLDYFLWGIAWICVAVFYSALTTDFEILGTSGCRWTFVVVSIGFIITLVVRDVSAYRHMGPLPGPRKETGTADD